MPLQALVQMPSAAYIYDFIFYVTYVCECLVVITLANSKGKHRYKTCRRVEENLKFLELVKSLTVTPSVYPGVHGLNCGESFEKII